LIIDILATLNIKNEQEKNFFAPEWRNTLFLFKFSHWKAFQKDQINKIFKLVQSHRAVNNQSLYQTIINYLHCHYKEPLTIKNIAEKFYLNPTYIGRVFSKAKGITIKQYLNDFRINEAKKLLLNTNKMIYEIASEVGFRESKYFISKFINSEGVSPAQYRKGKLSD
jgi:two-component system response regulator YesN